MNADRKTWIDPEEYCYPSGRMLRKGRAIVTRNPNNPIELPYGEIRAFNAGIPDTFFTIPAVMRYKGKRVRGYISIDSESGEMLFKPEAA